MLEDRKGQAAIEYLTTYGWAMIAAAIVIGAMYLVFFPNPQHLVPDSCTFTEDFICEEFQVTSDGLVNMSLRNMAGAQVTVEGVECVFEGQSYEEDLSVVISSGGREFVHCDTDFVFGGDLVNVRVNLDYVPDGYLFERRVTGSITGRPR